MGREFHIKGGEKILAIIKRFSATEKVIFAVFVLAALISALLMAWNINTSFLMSVPSRGGKLNEGIVGLPRSVNPVLAFTDVDRDLTNLIYAGLMKYEGGKIVPDLAQKYTVSPDGLTYTFTLKDDLRFHDGLPLTTDDVEFTIQKIQDNTVKSPLRANWANITIKKNGQKEIQFILKQPYSPFITNATVGIIPKHIWSKVSPDQFIFSQYNIEPVGSGPYQLKKIQRDNGGIPLFYSLYPFSRYHGGEAYIADLGIYFYPNEKALLEAYSNGIIESAARVSASETARIASTTHDIKILHSPLPRIFGIFFNQNQAPIFTHGEVRQALNMATDKDLIVRDVLYGYGVRSDGPLPKETYAGEKYRPDIEGAKALLMKAGWIAGSDGVLQIKDKKGMQILEFSIATADSPDLKQTASIIKKEWEQIGAKVTIKVFEYGDLYQNIIATRKYDALLFGESINKDLDLYAFWHSSQRNAPGLNVSMYVNSKVDKLLESARATSDNQEKENIYSQFDKIIRNDVPAIFLYSPEFIYIVPEKIKGLDMDYSVSLADRFYGINKWYITTDSVWKVFSQFN